MNGRIALGGDSLDLLPRVLHLILNEEHPTGIREVPDERQPGANGSSELDMSVVHSQEPSACFRRSPM